MLQGFLRDLLKGYLEAEIYIFLLVVLTILIIISYAVVIHGYPKGAIAGAVFVVLMIVITILKVKFPLAFMNKKYASMRMENPDIIKAMFTS
jgi:hypothetical protein